MLAPIVAKCLDWGLARAIDFSNWAIKKYKQHKRISDANEQLDKAVDNLIKTILEAKKDGEITDDEVQKIINAARSSGVKR